MLTSMQHIDSFQFPTNVYRWNWQLAWTQRISQHWNSAILEFQTLKGVLANYKFHKPGVTHHGHTIESGPDHNPVAFLANSLTTTPKFSSQFQPGLEVFSISTLFKNLWGWLKKYEKQLQLHKAKSTHNRGILLSSKFTLFTSGRNCGPQCFV